MCSRCAGLACSSTLSAVTQRSDEEEKPHLLRVVMRGATRNCVCQLGWSPAPAPSVARLFDAALLRWRGRHGFRIANEGLGNPSVGSNFLQFFHNTPMIGQELGCAIFSRTRSWRT